MRKKLTLALLALALLLAAFVQLQQGRAGDGPNRHSDKPHAAEMMMD